MKNLIAAAVFGAALSITSTSAFAVSCTQQGQECKGWAAGQGAQAASFSAKCSAEVGRCKARCKQGNKVFIGVSSSPQNYPISDCK